MNVKRRLSFTLIELLAVVAIILILASIMFTAFQYVNQKTAVTRTKSGLNILKNAINAYNADNGSWPDVFKNQQLSVIVTPKTENYNAVPAPGSLTDMSRNVILPPEEWEKTKGLFLYDNTKDGSQVFLQDQWGKEVVARRSATIQKAMNDGRVQNASEADAVKSLGSFDVFSLGPDGEEGTSAEGTEDDIWPDI